jgi:hypothetical protein
MKYLNLTTSTDPVNPNDGYPYVYYNHGIDTVWIFMGLRWILEDGRWVMKKSWSDTGLWNYYGPQVGFNL